MCFHDVLRGNVLRSAAYKVVTWEYCRKPAAAWLRAADRALPKRRDQQQYCVKLDDRNSSKCTPECLLTANHGCQEVITDSPGFVTLLQLTYKIQSLTFSLSACCWPLLNTVQLCMTQPLLHYQQVTADTTPGG